MSGVQRSSQILSVAYPVFAERGFDGVSMADIAERSGVTKPVIYSHFGSKEGLYAACAELLIEPMLEEVGNAARAATTPDQTLWEGILGQLRFIEANRDQWRVFVRDAALRGGAPGAALVTGRRRVTALLAELMTSAGNAAGLEIAKREAEALAHALQGAVEQVSNWWEENPEETAESVALRVMNFAWHGFGGLAAGKLWVPPVPQG